MWRSNEKCVVEGMNRSDMHVIHPGQTDIPNHLTPAVHACTYHENCRIVGYQMCSECDVMPVMIMHIINFIL